MRLHFPFPISHLKFSPTASGLQHCPAQNSRLSPELAGAVKVLTAEPVPGSTEKLSVRLVFEGSVSPDDLKNAVREAAGSDSYGSLSYSETALSDSAKPQALSVFDAATLSQENDHTVSFSLGCDRMSSFARYLLLLVNFIARR